MGLLTHCPLGWINFPRKSRVSFKYKSTGVGLMHLGWIFFYDEKAKQMLNMTLKRTVVLSGVIIIVIFCKWLC